MVLEGELAAQNRARFMAQMVLCALEQELGRFIEDRWTRLTPGNPVLREILHREPLLEVQPYSKGLISSAVASSYLKELFDLALVVAEGTPDRDLLAELLTLATAFQLFDIRNAAAHPNRPFFEYFWLRLAALAADPRITRLGLNDVVTKLEMAFAGRIEAPPEAWFKQKITLPNNLPTFFEHSSTGLVGRDEERRRLWNEFKSPRKHFFAVVSPGGNGKTALALDFLADLCCSTEGAAIADAVIYVSLKSHRLTAQGLENLSNPQTYEQLGQTLRTAFEAVFSDSLQTYNDAQDIYSAKRVVLFIDNVETLLLDRPDALRPFESRLPSSWRLMVTSRVPVDDAVTLPLGALRPPAAKRLVRNYFGSSGYPQPEESLVDKIVEGSKCNPLAIKLVVDTYKAGRDISESLVKGIGDATGFSFSGLLDALPKETIAVMEALFVEEEISRGALAEILNLIPDQVTTALHQLCRTSLASRVQKDGIEVISLNEQVRELLRLNPKDLAVRQLAEKGLRARRARMQQARATASALDVYDIDSIPPETPHDLAVLATQVGRALKGGSQERISASYRSVMAAEDDYGAHHLYWRIRARLLWELRDRSAALDCVERSIALNPEDFVSHRTRGQWLIEEQRMDEALHQFQDLVGLGGLDRQKVGDEFAGLTLTGLLRSKIYLGLFEEVAQATLDWFKSDLGFYLVGVRIRCFKRWSELPDADARRDQRFIHALNLFEQAVNTYGLRGVLPVIGRELLREIIYRVKGSNPTHSFVQASAGFLGGFLSDLTKPGDLMRTEAAELLPVFTGVLAKPKAHLEEVDSKALDDYKRKGACVLRIKPMPVHVNPEQSSFRFAVDEGGDEYFIHESRFVSEHGVAWKDVQEGTVVVAGMRIPSYVGSTKWSAHDVRPVLAP